MITPEDEWIVIENNHEPVVDETKFKTVQKLIEHRRSDRNIKKGLSNTSPHLLAGKLICMDCGNPMKRSGLSRDKKQHYIKCTLAAKSSNQNCTSHYTS